MSGTRAHFAFGSSGKIDVGNATDGVTHLCPTKVVALAYRQSTALFWTDSHQKLKIARRSLM